MEGKCSYSTAASVHADVEARVLLGELVLAHRRGDVLEGEGGADESKTSEG